ncbi:hypothetical protein FRZ67_07425 [Panacibacter ginsenosidivorans]|uniref:DUF922 domain-containing protein n=1 Tax=Panacibacter ginsenosidivorans TaxID=1813871 RepID=A0A5B8V9X6_9BACT|nr:DUF922 domain-containing protein [Panacibacter ginsenosidivorans]QEC67128.1 hypothetical protein FRZ67_07425 [Panacibacter ginsenosidivorans]
MKKAFIIISIIFSILPHKIFCQDTINWRPSYKLTWQDFRAKPDEASEFGALSDCSISYSFIYKDDSLSFKIASLFTRSKSWLKFRDDTILLKHEQGHFDINELFTRKLKKAFKAYSFNPVSVNKDLEAIFNKVWEEKKAFDARYDKETDHSINKAKQLEWSEMIATELNDLNEFK